MGTPAHIAATQDAEVCPSPQSCGLKDSFFKKKIGMGPTRISLPYHTSPSLGQTSLAKLRLLGLQALCGLPSLSMPILPEHSARHKGMLYARGLHADSFQDSNAAGLAWPKGYLVPPFPPR